MQDYDNRHLKSFQTRFLNEHPNLRLRSEWKRWSDGKIFVISKLVFDDKTHEFAVCVFEKEGVRLPADIMIPWTNWDSWKKDGNGEFTKAFTLFNL